LQMGASWRARLIFHEPPRAIRSLETGLGLGMRGKVAEP